MTGLGAPRRFYSFANRVHAIKLYFELLSYQISLK
jgi:hypothetical protein